MGKREGRIPTLTRNPKPRTALQITAACFSSSLRLVLMVANGWWVLRVKGDNVLIFDCVTKNNAISGVEALLRWFLDP